jgi:metallophosphoesterase (TIGR00282 family)
MARVAAFPGGTGILRLLFIGDVVGRPGRDLIRRGLPVLIERLAPDLVILNAENAAGGFGVTREVGDALLASGVDVMTSGNHIWDRRETIDYIGAESRLLRPINFPDGVPGNGSFLARTARGRPVGVINAMGRVFFPTNIDDPFRRVQQEVEALRARTRVLLVDFHAEATSEKIAMGWHLDGKVTAVIGTHTHVQTADEQILPQGTAYLTDAGMTGPHDSIIGVDKHAVLDKFLRGMPARLETATGNPRLNGVLIAADEATGKAVAIRRLSFTPDEIDRLPDESVAETEMNV